MSHYAYVKLHHVLQFQKKNTKHNKYFLQMFCKNNVFGFGDAIVL